MRPSLNVFRCVVKKINLCRDKRLIQHLPALHRPLSLAAPRRGSVWYSRRGKPCNRTVALKRVLLKWHTPIFFLSQVCIGLSLDVSNLSLLDVLNVHQVHTHLRSTQLHRARANMPPSQKAGVSLFEQRRQANIKENQAKLQEVSNSTVKISKPTPKPVKPRKPRTPVERRVAPKREAAVATRSSSRLKGEGPIKRENEDDIPAALMPDRPAKKSRIAEDLNLDKIMVEGRKFADDMSAFGHLLPKRGAEPGVRTFDDNDIRETSDKDLKSLRESMNSLDLYDKWAVNGRRLFGTSRSYALLTGL